MLPFTYEDLVTFRDLCAVALQESVNRLAAAVEKRDEKAIEREERLQQHFSQLLEKVQQEIERLRQ
jgi:hypothetical protein